jgi:hypothetical protein
MARSKAIKETSEAIYDIYKKLKQKSLEKRNRLSAEEFSSDLSNLSKKEKEALIDLGVLDKPKEKPRLKIDKETSEMINKRNQQPAKFSKGGFAKKTKWERKWG